jgi:hypothetical protein
MDAQKIIDDWIVLNNTETCLLFSGLTCRRLPPFPDDVEWLIIRWMTLEELPAIPDSVKRLVLWGVKVDELPPVPYDLEYLALAKTSIRILPRLPGIMNRWKKTSCQVYIQDCNYLLIPYRGQYSYEYAKLWNWWWTEQPASRLRSTRRCNLIKDELMNVTWHPSYFHEWCLDWKEQVEWGSVC